MADGSGNDQGIQIFDLTQLLNVDPNSPQTFVATNNFTGLGWSHNVVINEDTGYGYVVGASRSNGSGLNGRGLSIFDFNDPNNIFQVGGFSADGYTHDAQAVIYDGPDSDYVGREVVFACNEDTLTIVDVTDKSNTEQISRRPYSDSGYSHQGWLTEDHKYFYMNDELLSLIHI